MVEKGILKRWHQTLVLRREHIIAKGRDRPVTRCSAVRTGSATVIICVSVVTSFESRQWQKIEEIMTASGEVGDARTVEETMIVC